MKLTDLENSLDARKQHHNQARRADAVHVGQGEKIVKRGVLRRGLSGVAVSASFFVFHHCYLSFLFLRVCFVFTSPSLGSCFFLWSSYSVFVQGVLFVLSGFGSLFVLVLDPRGSNLI